MFSFRKINGKFLHNYKKPNYLLSYVFKHLSSSAAFQFICQPTHESHPHLIKNPEHITAGISLNEYKGRRSRLMELLHKQTERKSQQHHVVILCGSPRRYMIDKIPYLFRQDTDMLYMSGCLETDCTLILHSLGSSHELHKAVMFIPDLDQSKEIWDGPRTSLLAGPDVWGVSEVLPWSSFTTYLRSLVKETRLKNIWYHFTEPVNPDFDRLISTNFPKSEFSIQSPKPFIHTLRVVKSPAEIDLMRETCRISSQALTTTMARCTAPSSEHFLAATLDYESRIRGAEHLAYPPVVAGGNRANIIHYIDNNNMVNAGEMVLIDAGCELRGYSGDVTRTFPVNGEFTSPQRELYEAVLHTQSVVMEACSARPSLDKLFTLMCSTLGFCLQELSILPKSLTGIQLCRAAFSFCPHHVSHYLGMDVHDTPSVLKSDKIPINSIITVEPGIYINANNKEVDQRFTGIGIRLEDDILITDGGVEVLTEECPKHPDLIQKLVGSSGSPETR